MSYLNNLERRYRKFSISNITVYVIVGMIFFYVMSLIKPEILDFIMLDPVRVMQGEVWRLVTFIFMPINSNPIWLLLGLYFFYWVGNSLENHWGSFRFTLYYLGFIAGAGLAVILSAVIGGFTYIYAYGISTFFTMSLFLVFAWYFGEEEILIMFVFPIKVKYLAAVDVLMILYALYSSSWGGRIVMLASMINLIIFYAVVLTKKSKYKKRYVDFKVKTIKAERASQKAPRHRCTVCGATEKTNPEIEFRYCSKCSGDHEFCEKHLFSHEHISNIVDFKKPGE